VAVVGAVGGPGDRPSWRSFAPALAPYQPDEQKLRSPIEARADRGPRSSAPDRFGRDVLSRRHLRRPRVASTWRLTSDQASSMLAGGNAGHDRRLCRRRRWGQRDQPRDGRVLQHPPGLLAGGRRGGHAAGPGIKQRGWWPSRSSTRRSSVRRSCARPCWAEAREGVQSRAVAPAPPGRPEAGRRAQAPAAQRGSRRSWWQGNRRLLAGDPSSKPR